MEIPHQLSNMNCRPVRLQVAAALHNRNGCTTAWSMGTVGFAVDTAIDVAVVGTVIVGTVIVGTVVVGTVGLVALGYMV